MKKSLFVVALWASLGTSTAMAAVAWQVAPPPPIAAKAYLLLDAGSGQELAALKADERVEPASLTKLMTAYLTFKAIKDGRLKLDQVVPVSERAWKAEGSRMFIQPGKPVTVQELIQGMIVQSGNDACIALAEALAGSEEAFAQMMNQEAKRLGMKASHFVNATGLAHPEHTTTARDLGLLTQALIRDFPAQYPIYAQKEFRYNNITQTNRNLLLWRDPHVDGVKTGHTASAGFCLIASARRDGRRVISVVLNTASEQVRASESQKLLNYGLQMFVTTRVYEGKKQIATVPVWKGSSNLLSVGVAEDVQQTLPKGQGQVESALVTRQPLLAPITQGQVVGTIRLTYQGQLLREVPAVALQTIPQAGFFGRMWDAIKLSFN